MSDDRDPVTEAVWTSGDDRDPIVEAVWVETCRWCGAVVVPHRLWGWIHPPNRVSCCGGKHRAKPVTTPR